MSLSFFFMIDDQRDFNYPLDINLLVPPHLFLHDGMCSSDEKRRWRRTLGQDGAATTPERTHGSRLGQNSHNPWRPALATFIQQRSGRQMEGEKQKQVNRN